MCIIFQCFFEGLFFDLHVNQSSYTLKNVQNLYEPQHAYKKYIVVKYTHMHT